MTGRPLFVGMAAVCAAVALYAAAPHAAATIPELDQVRTGTDRGGAPTGLRERLRHEDTAREAVLEAQGLGRHGTGMLVDVALDADVDLVARGRAIVALSGVGGHDVDATLRGLHEDAAEPVLVRTWAAAARIQRAQDVDAVLALTQLQRSFPALARPIGMKFETIVASSSAREVVAMSMGGGAVQQAAARAIRGMPLEDLVALVYSDTDDGVRRQAAAWVGNRAGTEGDAVRSEVLDTLEVRRVVELPWAGGALYVPSAGWDEASGQELVERLIGWYVVADRAGLDRHSQAIWNNLYSVGLLNTAGFGTSLSRDSDALLAHHARVMGSHASERLQRDIDAAVGGLR